MLEGVAGAALGLVGVVVAPGPDLDLGEAGDLLDVVQDRPALGLGQGLVLLPGGLVAVVAEIHEQAAGRQALIDDGAAPLGGQRFIGEAGLLALPEEGVAPEVGGRGLEADVLEKGPADVGDTVQVPVGPVQGHQAEGHLRVPPLRAGHGHQLHAVRPDNARRRLGHEGEAQIVAEGEGEAFAHGGEDREGLDRLAEELALELVRGEDEGQAVGEDQPAEVDLHLPLAQAVEMEVAGSVQAAGVVGGRGWLPEGGQVAVDDVVGQARVGLGGGPAPGRIPLGADLVLVDEVRGRGSDVDVAAEVHGPQAAGVDLENVHTPDGRVETGDQVVLVDPVVPVGDPVHPDRVALQSVGGTGLGHEALRQGNQGDVRP